MLFGTYNAVGSSWRGALERPAPYEFTSMASTKLTTSRGKPANNSLKKLTNRSTVFCFLMVIQLLYTPQYNIYMKRKNAKLPVLPHPRAQNLRMYDGTYELKTLTKARYMLIAPSPIQVKVARKK